MDSRNLEDRKTRYPRLMLAATASGSGKTLLTCGILEMLRSHGYNPMAFKCGPDYIDPMFHRSVIGIPSDNLDSYFASEGQLQACLYRGSEKSQIGIIEGVMGLYDGLGGTQIEGSSYDIACKTGTPIVLVVNAKGMSLSLIALLRGFLEYDNHHLIKGVILNRVGRTVFELLQPKIQELGLVAVGFVPEQDILSIDSRHLGLQMPYEVLGLQEKIREFSSLLCQGVTEDVLGNIAQEAKPIGIGSEVSETGIFSKERVRIGIAQDRAFNFYYEDNLRILRELGADLIPFSPLQDSCLPEKIGGILLGGGYPELYGKELAENVSFRESLKEALQKGMPSIAECGGFLYLHEELQSPEGDSYAMVGILPDRAEKKNRLVRFGYLEAEGIEGSFLPEQERMRGHEFHYYDTRMNGEDIKVTKPISQKSWKCIHAGRNYWWGFPHFYYGSNLHFVENFIHAAREYGKNESK